ncbi:YPR097W [Saccharomyces arboricola H-6]|uniref:YPR097W n=1 Tax=Saccharomyces arboricola (strain H-6 / AS 2.3317 / CBS 10644) TaxID=1160507 RepID=J8PV74_SACAR|nr:YPR097W [Saccharomyces arboricola H-6]
MPAQDIQLLNPTEEHYLKRELLRFQLDHEIEGLNDQFALRKFGYPFSLNDPKVPETISDGNSSLTPSGKGHFGSNYPMLSYILQEFISTFPLLSTNSSVDEMFWQSKVQVFFEHFMSLGFSESYDREEASKRKKISKKLSKVILLLFNSGVGSSQEQAYYTEDKFVLQSGQVRKRSNIEKFAMPTRENLENLLTNESILINGWDVNIISVFNKNSRAPIGQTDNAKSPKSTPTSSPRSHGIKTFASTSKWMKNAFNSTISSTINSMPESSASLFSKLSLSVPSAKGSGSRKHHYFLIKIKKQENDDGDSGNDKEGEYFHIARTYSDFKKLSHDLKSEFPGKKCPRLPHRNKKVTSMVTKTEVLPNGHSKSTTRERIVNTFDTDIQSASESETSSFLQTTNESSVNETILTENDTETLKKKILNEIKKDENAGEEDDEGEESDFDEYKDATDSKVNTLVGEKMRTSLRQYLRSLCKDIEVSQSVSIHRFLLSGPNLNLKDLNLKVVQDIKNRSLIDVSNLENQIRFQQMALEKSLKLQDSMKDFKTSLLKDEKYLMSLLGEIKENTKVEDLSPLLQDFVEWCKIYISSMIYQVFLGNDNSYEFYTQIRRLHKLMPYTVMGQIMKFTNPIAVMKGMIELFMAQPFGSHSLLQTMFSTILTDDLKTQKLAIKDLERKITEMDPGAPVVIKCLKDFIFSNGTKDGDETNSFTMEAVNAEAESMNMPVPLIILIKSAAVNLVSDEVVAGFIESYSSWKMQREDMDNIVETNEENIGNYFVHVKDLLQLYIKEHDKQLMKQLWQDPELTQMIKAIVTMIYEPMVSIFKIARMDVALRNFEKFMSDLIKLIDDVISGRLGVSTQFNVVEEIHNLVNKHQNAFFEFIHDVYLNDSEGIFEGFVSWITTIVKFLQKSKFGETSERIDFNKLVSREDIDIDLQLLKTQVNDVIDKKISARKMYKQLLDLKVKHGAKQNNKHATSVLQRNWEDINSLVIPSSSGSFGLGDGDLVDLDLDTGDYDFLHKENEIELEKQYQDLLNRVVDESEIDKLRSQVFAQELKNYLEARVARK